VRGEFEKQKFVEIEEMMKHTTVASIIKTQVLDHPIYIPDPGGCRFYLDSEIYYFANYWILLLLVYLFCLIVCIFVYLGTFVDIAIFNNRGFFYIVLCRVLVFF